MASSVLTPTPTPTPSSGTKKSTKKATGSKTIEVAFDVLKKFYEARNYDLVLAYYQQHKKELDNVDEAKSIVFAASQLRTVEAIDPVQQSFNCAKEKKLARDYFQYPENVAGGLESMSGMPQEREEVMGDILSFQYPQVLKRKIGILLYGPPGTGKTVIAREIATAIWKQLDQNAAFFLFSGNNLKGAYYSNTEKNVGAAFFCAQELAAEMAKDQKKAAASVVFMDEVDSLVISRKTGSAVDVSTTNAVLRAIDPKLFANTYLIAATNFPDNLDPAFNSRVPKRIFVDLPSDAFRRQLIVDTVRAFYLLPDMKDLEKRLKAKGIAPTAALAMLTDSLVQKTIDPADVKQLQKIKNAPNRVYRLVWELTKEGNEFLPAEVLAFVTLRTGVSPEGYDFMQKRMGTREARVYLESRGRSITRDGKPTWSLFGFSARDVVALVDGTIEKAGLAFLRSLAEIERTTPQAQYTSRMFQREDFEAAAANVFASLNDPEEYWRYLQYYLFKGAPPTSMPNAGSEKKVPSKK